MGRRGADRSLGVNFRLTFPIDSQHALPHTSSMNTDHLKPATARAVLRVSRHGSKQYLVALCPIGHIIDTTEITAPGFAGSSTDANWSAHQHGAETRWDRLASKCDGAGH